MFPVGDGDEGEGGSLAREDVAPGDLKTLLLPLLPQQPEDLVKVRLPEFWEVPLRKSKTGISTCEGAFRNKSI